MQTPAELIKQGMAALKRGDKDQAFTLFAQALQQDPHQEQAWLWMSGAVRTPAEQRYCLERVLEINPQHTTAQRGLAKLPAGESVDPLAAITNASPQSEEVISPTTTTDTPNAEVEPDPTATDTPNTEGEPDPAATTAVQAEAVPAAATGPDESPVAAAPSAPASQRSAKRTASKPKRETYRYQPGQSVGSYRIVEHVGQNDDRELYLVREGDPNWLFWMLVSPTTIEPLSGQSSQKQFTQQGLHYLVMPLAATPASVILMLLPAARFKFIGVRWVQLARHFGYLHDNGQVYQRNRDFNLESIHFGAAGGVSPVSYHRPSDQSLTFIAPERAGGSVTPAGDVYVLGASLLTLLGEASPSEVFARQNPVVGPAMKEHAGLYQVLKRATDPQPERRYKNGNEFADALARLLGDVLPQEERGQGKVEKPRSAKLVIWALVTMIIIFLFVGVYQLTKDTDVAWSVPFFPTAKPASDNVDERLQFTNLYAQANGTELIELQATIKRGGMLLPPDEDIDFSVRHNGTRVNDPKLDTLDGGRYQLSFPTKPLAGTYEVLARVDEHEAARKVYFDPNPSNIDLINIASGGIQVDTYNYPEINVYFGVVDEAGQAVQLGGNFDVSVLQDDQPVELFVMAPVDITAEPLTVALAVDVSGSMYGEPLVAARQAAVTFVRQLGPGDTVCLYAFATQVQQIGACSTDRQAIIDAINGLETIDDTSIYDALVRVSSDMAELPGRKAIILLSDGADTKSTASFDVALATARKSNMPVYSVGLISEQFDGRLLEQLARETNGIYKLTPRPEEIQELYNQVQRQLEKQYRVTFQSIFPQRRNGMVTVRMKHDEQSLEIKRPFQL
jgi:VWFA-related protein